MKFVKMHGIGNDYVYVDAVSDPSIERRSDLAELARRLSDRHIGVGGDGLILVCRPREGVDADVRMRMFNADGSESEMCGNGVRCVAKFAHDRLGERAAPMRVETGRGVLPIDYEVQDGALSVATVDMGEPILEPAKVPVELAGLGRAAREHEYTITADGRGYAASFVSMGNPHAVVFLDDAAELSGLDLRRIGPLVERHAAFPRRVNVHFVHVPGRAGTSGIPSGEATMRTWERGTGITLACGTGACAVCVAGVRTGRLARRVLLHLPGGDLTIRWDGASGRVFTTGPAAEAFEGEWRERAEATREEGRGVIEPPVLRTARLTLRPYRMSDAPALAAVCADKRVARMTLTIPHPYTLADAERFIAGHRATYATGAATPLAITIGSDGTGELVGGVGLRIERAHDRAELGYMIGTAHWGKGYATEAARAVVAYGFERLGLNRIHACHFIGNPASGRVLEKIGMRPEGVSRANVKKWGAYDDDVRYAALRSEWSA